jgi:hypothetical protein
VKKREKLQLARRQFAGQFDPGGGLLALSWPLHSQYRIRAGKIYGDGYDGRSYEPLDDPDLFLSFIRLGKRGRPSKESILRWVHLHGLLRRDLGEGVNQSPMTVDDFREEVRCARELAALFMDIREQNAPAIWARFVGEGEYGDAQSHINPVDSHFATFQRDESFRRSLEPPEHPYHLMSGVAAFESILEELLKGVRLQPLSDDFVVEEQGSLRIRSWEPGTPYHPVISWRCPDLHTALYLQFALMATNSKPWRRCAAEDCRLPFQPSRKDKLYCDPPNKSTCRSRARKFR